MSPQKLSDNLSSLIVFNFAVRSSFACFKVSRSETIESFSPPTSCFSRSTRCISLCIILPAYVLSCSGSYSKIPATDTLNALAIFSSCSTVILLPRASIGFHVNVLQQILKGIPAIAQLTAVEVAEFLRPE